MIIYNYINMINSAMNKSPNIVIIGSGWACKSFTNTIDKDKFNVKIISKPFIAKLRMYISDYKPTYCTKSYFYE